MAVQQSGSIVHRACAAWTTAASVTVLAACASGPPPPLYSMPPDTAASAEVDVVLMPAMRHHFEGLRFRGRPQCAPDSLLSAVLPKVIEEPGPVIARSTDDGRPHSTRLPAGQPLALQFWRVQVTDVSRWNFVVLLASGGRYRAGLQAQGGPTVIDIDTGAEALRLPPNILHSQLQCP